MGMKWQRLIGRIKGGSHLSQQPEMAHPRAHACMHTYMRAYTQTHRCALCERGSLTIYAWLGESHTVSPVRWEARVEWVDTDMVYCQVQAQARAHWPVSLFLKAWIKLWSRCRVNMKAFTAVKKSRLWLELDVWERFLMPAFADDSPFKSSRAVAGSLPSQICWIDDFTSSRHFLRCFARGTL